MSTHQGGKEIHGSGVLVRLRDGEIIEGRVEAFDLDSPDLLLTDGDPSTNNRSALIPLSSVKSVRLERRDLHSQSNGNGNGRVVDGTGLRKVVIHYWDGDVVTGLIGQDVERHQHGLKISLISPGLDVLDVLAIPHSAIKAVFFVKTWDSRAGEYFRETAHWSLHRADTPLVDLLSEIHNLSQLRHRGELTTDEFQRRRRQVLERI